MQQLPKAVLFDLDGTLIDSASDLTVAVDRMLSALSLPKAGFERVSSWIGNGAQKLIERALTFAVSESSASGSSKDLYLEARSIFDRVYSECCARATGLYPGAEELLLWCREVDLPLALITNKPEQFTHQILSSLSLAQYFQVVVGGDTLEERKPSSLPLTFSANQLGVDLDDCWMVGDSRSDVVAGRSAGCSVIGMTYGYNHGRSVAEENPDFVCDSLNILLDRLKRLHSEQRQEISA